MTRSRTRSEANTEESSYTSGGGDDTNAVLLALIQSQTEQNAIVKEKNKIAGRQSDDFRKSMEIMMKAQQDPQQPTGSFKRPLNSPPATVRPHPQKRMAFPNTSNFNIKMYRAGHLVGECRRRLRQCLIY